VLERDEAAAALLLKLLFLMFKEKLKKYISNIFVLPVLQ